MTERELVTQKAYADHAGVSFQYISRLVRQGVLPKHDGRLDKAECDAILAGERQRFRSGDSLLLLKARTQFEQARAGREEIRLARERSAAVSVADVERAVAGVNQVVRTRLLQVSSKVAVGVPMEWRTRVKKLVNAEIHECLAELSDPASLAFLDDAVN